VLWAQVCSNLAGSSIYLVRHAEKLDGPDPGLTAAGLARAEALKDRLAGIALDAIYVTQWQRTQLTAAPIAEARGLSPIVHSTEGRPISEHVRALIADLNANHCGETVLLVGHSNTLPRIIYSLTGKQIGKMDRQTYNRLFHVRFQAGQPVELIRTDYGAPNPTAGH
jgi:broad specificity phosphatase PhoE